MQWGIREGKLWPKTAGCRTLTPLIVPSKHPLMKSNYKTVGQCHNDENKNSRKNLVQNWCHYSSYRHSLMARKTDGNRRNLHEYDNRPFQKQLICDVDPANKLCWRCTKCFIKTFLWLACWYICVEILVSWEEVVSSHGSVLIHDKIISFISKEFFHFKSNTSLHKLMY